MAGKGRVLWAGEGEKARYYANEGKGKKRGRSNSSGGKGKGAWIPSKYMTKGQRAKNGF